MSTNNRTHNGGAAEKPYFESQRELLLDEIATNMEHVLQNINKLNRNLESVIAVGNEFSQVEGLWSQFESVMAKPDEAAKDDTNEGSTGRESR
ncbi:hypothetical protein CAC42_6252 [Sphaceloma murrayae]|uniref:DASH complex subunit DAD1 n=1 Tax=Sphaceloma murrayae TaxID=2082308 RepID=A0A2K1QTQ7_9PEZI|nr:hypothetical protein CAC42_6252 [Sphaceloma murrayae]